MEYRAFGKTGQFASVLGFGMMRLKRKEDDTIDEAWAIKTLRSAIDRGLNYLDTAYVYKDSERVTGLCLQDGYREKVMLASKLPVANMTCEEDFEKILEEQLQRLQTDCIDVYLLHGLNRNTWDDHIQRFHVLEHAEKAKAAGKIKYLGFSFHDSLEAFLYILNAYDRWDMCQIQLNYMDVQYQAGLEGLRQAHEKGLAVVIMEPLRGGTLANVPEEVASLLPRPAVESALSFLWNMEQVSVVLSGMSETEQVEQNLSLAENAHADMLTEEEVQQLIAAGDQMRAMLSIPCTGCNYCDVCPQGISIPDIFAIRNRRQLDGDSRGAKARYKEVKVNAETCLNCGVCQEKCPQHIAIPEKLAEIHKQLG